MTVQVTGCAHSATLWLTQALARCGVPATHEVTFHFNRDPIVPRTPVDVGWPAVPYLPVEGLAVARIVRDPLLVVRSICRSRFLFKNRAARLFVEAHRPDIFDVDDLARVVRYVATWCPPISPTYRVEDGPATVRAVAAMAGHNIDPLLARDVCDELGTAVHTHNPDRTDVDADVTWPAIRLCPDGEALARQARDWGYL